MDVGAGPKSGGEQKVGNAQLQALETTDSSMKYGTSVSTDRWFDAAASPSVTA